MKVGKRFESRGRARRVGLNGGQAVVELALIVPLLMVLLIGVIELGRYAYFDILISNAARAGAQYGAQSLIQAADLNGITAAAHNDGLAAMTITTQQECTCISGNPPGGCGLGACPKPIVYVEVTATDTYPSLFNYPLIPIPTSIRLSSTVTMRVGQ